MGLTQYVAPSHTVMVESANGPLPVTVFGVGFDAIVHLMRVSFQPIAGLYSLAVEGKFNYVTAIEAAGYVTELAPDLIARIIAVGCGEPEEEAVQAAATLPLTVQIELLEAIARLTFKGDAGRKKFLEIVDMLLQSKQETAQAA